MSAAVKLVKVSERESFPGITAELMRGYMEHACVNLNLADDSFEAENEALTVTENFYS